MKISRTKCFVMAGVMTLSLMSSAFAAKFPDVTSTSYGWALEAVEEMTESGIIKGYEDGSFRPANTVTKLEALVLISRILGVNDEENEGFMEFALEEYGDLVADYDLPYGDDEIVYLLAKEVIAKSELSGYIGGANPSTGLKRFEVAVLMTKAMGAEEQVKQNLVTVLDYDDEADIPSYAKKYVEYVTNEGIMKGMDENNFSPNTDVVRAQIAVLLQRIIKLADIQSYSGTVSSIDTLLGVVRFKTSDGETYGYSIKDDTQLRYDAMPCEIGDIKVGYDAIVTTRGGKLFSIDFMTPDVEELVKGSITSISKTSKSQQIKMEVFLDDGSTQSKTFTCADNVVIKKDGTSNTLNDISTGDYAELTIKKDKIVSIYAEPKASNAKGVVTDITLNAGILTMEIENTDGDKETFTVSNEAVTVTRNGSKADIKEVMTGDSVSLTLNYRKVVKIVATSRTSTKTGLIEEINISANPSVVLKINGENVKYSISKDVEISVDGKVGTIYDLRLNSSATVKLDSNAVTKLTTTPVETVSQITGTIDFVNVSYGLVQVTYFDTASEQNVTRSVFVGKNTKIIDNSTSKEITLKTLEAGSTITAVGTSTSGVFEASTIILIGAK